jgi:DNA-nicking Smr family endonuclease
VGKKLPTLDLHGFKKDEVFDAVDRFIMKHQSAAQIKIMPGKGEGIVRSELLRYLKLGGYPWAYEEMPNGQKNTGSVIVFL